MNSSALPVPSTSELVPILVGQPVVNTKFDKEHFGINGAAASRALSVLAEKGILKEASGNSCNRIWQHNGILEVLNGYAAQVRRDCP